MAPDNMPRNTRSGSGYLVFNLYICHKVRLVRNMKAGHIERIRLMEAALEQWIALGNEGERLLSAMQAATPQLEELITYYSSPDWFVDKERSDRNELPEDLPCGVLSEDAVFDLLTQLHGLLEMTRELERHMRDVPRSTSLPPIPD